MIVLRRPKFKTNEEEINKIILTVVQTAEIVTLRSNFEIIKEDPQDDMILNTAYDGNAMMIVSGDKHLLRLQVFKGIKIVRISEAMTDL